jgi:hypothetical protein
LGFWVAVPSEAKDNELAIGIIFAASPVEGGAASSFFDNAGKPDCDTKTLEEVST